MKMSIKSNKIASYTLLLFLPVVVYASAVVFPVLFSFVLSFTNYNGFEAPQFIAFGNYIKMFKDEIFIHCMRNNILIVLVSIFGQIPIGMALAYILYRKLVKGSTFFTAMIFLPFVLSVIVVAILFNRFFSPSGIFTQIMKLITQNQYWVFTIQQDKNLSIIPVLFVILWMYTGFYMIVFLADMQKISTNVLEAAVVDGANEAQIFMKIILPSLTPVIFTTGVLAIAGSLKSFGLIYAMTAGKPSYFTKVVAMYMYDHSIKYGKYGFGSAVSVVIVLCSAVLITVLKKWFDSLEEKYN